MKKNAKTRLTALMFAAAGVGGIFTVCSGDVLYRVPTDVADAESTTTTTSAAARSLAGNSLRVSAHEEFLGDVNLDGRVDVKDAVRLQKFLLGKKVNVDEIYSDMDMDGEVDVYDLGLLKQKLIEMNAPQPLYGPPPEWLSTTAESITTTIPQDVYGPPNWFTTETSITTYPITQPLYGPPEWFTTTETEEETTKPEEETTETTTTTATITTPETTMETLYGPPNFWR